MSKKPRLHKCSKCGETAVWLWMPFSDTPRRRFFCDDCVPRNCRFCIDNTVHGDGEPMTEARVKWRGTDDQLHDERQKGCDIYCYVDEKGRPDPCYEYMYCNEGFEHDHPKYTIDFSIVRSFLDKLLHKEKYQDINDVIKELIWKFEYSVLGTNTSSDYREIIQWFKRECEYYMSIKRSDRHWSLIDSFFTYLKQTLYSARQRVYPEFEDDIKT